jgi:hypothetical protein
MDDDDDDGGDDDGDDDYDGDNADGDDDDVDDDVDDDGDDDHGDDEAPAPPGGEAAQVAGASRIHRGPALLPTPGRSQGLVSVSSV